MYFVSFHRISYSICKDMIRDGGVDINVTESSPIWSPSQQEAFCERFLHNFCFPPVIFGWLKKDHVVYCLTTVVIDIVS